MPKTVGIVMARGGSKGLPGKNIINVAGKPLIAWTIEAALSARRLDRLIVSTDDPTIAQVARACGAEVPFMRPAELATDHAAGFDVLIHCLDWLERDRALPDYVFTLQPTSPLRTAEDIDAAVAMAVERDAKAVVGVTRTQPHPYLAMIIHRDGTMTNLIQPGKQLQQRQTFPDAYSVNGAVYVNRCAALRADRTAFPIGALAYVMPAERAVDVDSLLDIVLVEYLLRRRLQNG